MKEEGKEPEEVKEVQTSVKVSESLKKFIEQDNRAYEEELKQVKIQEKNFNAQFFVELQKTMQEAARQQLKENEGYLKQRFGRDFGGPGSGAGGFFGGTPGGFGGDGGIL